MDIPDNWLWLTIGGVLSGILAGLLGIGGGTLLGPFLIALNYPAVVAFATSGLAVVITSSAGTVQNWLMGYLKLKQVVTLGLPSLLTAQIGVLLANHTKAHSYILLIAFALLSLLNIYLLEIKKQAITKRKKVEKAAQALEEAGEIPPELITPPVMNPWLARIITGGVAGLLAGLFGIGGGVIMVPLQILWLGEAIKPAIQISLAVVVITAISATVGHALSHNILLFEGAILGVGGLVGVQFSTRLLPKLPDRIVSLLFRGYLGLIALYMFWRALQLLRLGH